MSNVKYQKSKIGAGFTLIELLVVLTIFTILSFVGVTSLFRYRAGQGLLSSAREIAATLRDTALRAASGEGGTKWGVSFWNSTSSQYYEVWSGPSYASGTVEQIYQLKSNIVFGDPVAGASSTIVFQNVTGYPDSPKSILVQLGNNPKIAKFIDVNSLGAVSVRDKDVLTVSSITPNTGENTGTVSITKITGKEFISGATVKLERQGYADIPGTGFTVTLSTEITGGSFDITGAAPGTWSVTVTNPDGESASLGAGFLITTPPPIVDSINPNSAITGETVNNVSVTGSRFQSGASVKLSRSGESDIVGTGFVFIDSTLLDGGSLDLADAAVGNWDVVVINPDGKSGTGENLFTVNPIPTPLLDASSGGANVTGTGSCGGASAWEHEEICVRVPNGTPTGTQPVRVRSKDFDSNTSGFTVK